MENGIVINGVSHKLVADHKQLCEGCHFEIEEEKIVVKWSREELKKMVKKPHLSFVEEVIGLYDTIDNLQHKVNCLSEENKNLKSIIDTPSMKLANAIDEYINIKETTLKHEEVPGIIKENIEKHLDVSVETDGYCDKWGEGGRYGHHHKSEATVKWKD